MTVARMAGSSDICGEDGARQATLTKPTRRTPEEHARWVQEEMVPYLLDSYQPFDLWERLGVYVEMVVEKIDLKSLFGPVCEEYCVPLTNVRGWADLNSRAALMERMKKREAEGKRCVLRICVDHDPGGLRIAEKFRNDLADLSKAVGWDPAELEIVRFGLNADFIEAHGLTWIDNLETGSGESLADPLHADHDKAYVQDYIRKFGARKGEANALLRRPEAGRGLCRGAIESYVRKSDLDRHSRRLKRARREAWVFLPAAARRFARGLEAK